MGIVDLVAEIIRKHLGEDILDLLRLYEQTYPPDWGLEVTGGSIMDFRVVGGDISIVGFWYNSDLDSITALAAQDLILRLLLNDTHSRFLNSFGIGPIEDLPREALQGAVALAATNSPYISELKNIQVIEGEADEVDIRIEAFTPTGDSVGFGIPAGGTT